VLLLMSDAVEIEIEIELKIDGWKSTYTNIHPYIFLR
jgi:hypothetical protein